MLTRTVSSEWSGLLATLDVQWDGTTVVTGTGAESIADAIQRAGARPIAGSGESVAVCSSSGAFDLTDATSAATGLDDDVADLVIVSHGWTGPSTVGPALGEARRIARPGAPVIACELDFGRILRSRPAQYLSSLLYRARPDVAAAVAARHIDPAILEISMVRAGLRASQVTRFERTVRLAPLDEYLADVSVRGWRGAELVDAADSDAIVASVEEIAPRLARQGIVTETEPWVVVRGRA